MWAALLLVLALLMPAIAGSQSYLLHLLFSVFVFATLGRMPGT